MIIRFWANPAMIPNHPMHSILAKALCSWVDMLSESRCLSHIMLAKIVAPIAGVNAALKTLGCCAANDAPGSASKIAAVM